MKKLNASAKKSSAKSSISNASNASSNEIAIIPFIDIPNKDAKKEKIKELNLDSFASKLSSLEIKGKKEKESLYNYPDGFSKSDINSDKGKKFRNSLRNQRDRIMNNILFFYKGKKKDECMKEIENWNAFYKMHYAKNDYSIASISSSSDASKNFIIESALEIIKSIL